MHEASIGELLRAMNEGRTSATELTRSYLDRISALDPALNSFISVTGDVALREAAAADQLRADGKTLPLLGIPIAHKDIFCAEGVRTTAGSRMLDNFISPYDATVTRRLREAGAIMLGKTNMDEFAMGSSTENSFYGDTRNPWDTNRVPGGSSGGSAAAVAARLCVAATGTDTGGSIRQPAALCGVTGVKPTYGRVSRWGMIAFASSLDQAGPMARSAEDAARLLGVMSGFDPKDSTSIDADVPDYVAGIGQSIKGLRIGVCQEYFADGLDPATGKALQEAMAVLKRLGAELHDVSLPATRYSIPAYYVIAPAECSANLSRYDGVRFGYRCEQPTDLEDLYTRSRSEAFGREVKHRIMLGTFALSAGYYDAYYKKAQQIRRLIKNDFARAFETVDVIIGPVSPTPAFRLGEKVDNPLSMYLQDIYTIASNLAGLPALSTPAGFVDGLPVGLQIIGNYMDEARILNVAHLYQQETDWHTCAPGMAIQ